MGALASGGGWKAAAALIVLATVLTAAVWLSPEDGPRWWNESFDNVLPAPAAFNVGLLLLTGLAYGLSLPRRPGHWAAPAPRPLLPIRARTMLFTVWLALNAWWLVQGIRERDFQKKPSWLKQSLVPSRASSFSEGTLAALRYTYNTGMAAAWPLLANLALLLLPNERSLFLLSCAGASHEDGVRAHAWCGAAVWAWGTLHAVLVQLPMLAAGLWRVIVLPAPGWQEGKGTTNFMGLLAWLCLTAMALSSMYRVRRAAFNAFQRLHLALFPAVLLLGCLHDGKVFWYVQLGSVAYAADLLQRAALRRRAVAATATLYPLSVADARAGGGEQRLQQQQGGGGKAAEGGGRFVVLRIDAAAAAAGAGAGGKEVCYAGQHVWLMVPGVSCWEWHPYSVVAHSSGQAGSGGMGAGGGSDTGAGAGARAGGAGGGACGSFVVVVKAGGDWERRLCDLVEAAGGEDVPLQVVYEGMYGTPDLQAAACAAERLLLFAGGSGVTPLASVLTALLRQEKERDEAVAAAGGGGGGGLGVAGMGGGGAEAPSGAGWSVAEGVLQVATGLPRAPPRVELVWAVQHQDDAAPLAPLLEAAAARGWAVHLHITRDTHVAGGGPGASRSAAYANGHDSPSHAHTHTHKHHHGRHHHLHRNPHPHAGNGAVPGSPPGAAKSAGSAGNSKSSTKGSARGSCLSAPWSALLPPWQLSGLACWLLLLLVAAGAAVGHIAASRTLARVSSCPVAAQPDGTFDIAGVRHAFAVHAAMAGRSKELLHTLASSHHHQDQEQQHAAGVVAPGGNSSTASSVAGVVDSDDLEDDELLLTRSGTRSSGRASVLGAAARRVLMGASGAGHDGLGAGEDGEAYGGWTCPLGVAPRGKVAEAAASSVDVRVCWTVGISEPELCVKCDPLKKRSAKEEAWPCCTSPRCFFAPKGAQLAGWVVGGAVAGLAGCAAWAAVAVGLGGRQRRRGVSGARVGGWRVGRGRAGEEEREALMGAGRGEQHEAAEAGRASREPLRALLAAEGLLLPAGGGVQWEGVGAAGTAAAAGGAWRYEGGGIYVHQGRPDVDACLRAAVAAAGGEGGGGKRAAVRPVCGVAVCGPEGLSAAVRGAYLRRLANGGAWFRDFSFTS